MTKLYAGVAAATVLAFLGGTAAWFTLARGGDAFADCRGGQVGGGAIGGPFTLLDGSGAPVTDAQVLDKPALVYFGYTFCPDVCPLDNTRNVEAVDILEERGIEVTPVFITVDPARDTPEVMGEYAEMMHPRMIGLSGSTEQIDAAAKTYKVYYRLNPAEDGFYLVDHSTFTYLMLPGNRFVDFFKREATAEQMAERVACFVGADDGQPAS